MPIPYVAMNYLCEQEIEYEVINHPRTDNLEQAAGLTRVPLHKFARCIMLKDDNGLVMVVLPVNYVLDFNAIHTNLGRPFLDLADPDDFSEIFSGCENGSYPPIGEAFNVESLVDESLLDGEHVYFEPGIHTALLRICGSGFCKISKNARKGRFAHPLSDMMNADLSIQYTPHTEIKRRVEQIYDMPVMPEMATRIMKLRNNPDASVDDLASIVELDPSLAAQVLRYAASPLFGYKGKIKSVHHAISRVLGYDMVMNMAVGIAIGRSFRITKEGPLGLDAFWQHATYCAALTQELAKLLPESQRPSSGMVYLTGLLHNFGFLLLGQLFQPEFYLLNKLAAANPKTPITQLEQCVLGLGHAQGVLEMGHAQIGAWLMRAWNLPEEIIIATREHHNLDYNGAHSDCVHLIMVANRLLKRYGIGDALNDELPDSVLDSLGLKEEQAVEIMEALMNDGEDLNAMAQQMAA